MPVDLLHPQIVPVGGFTTVEETKRHVVAQPFDKVAPHAVAIPTDREDSLQLILGSRALNTLIRSPPIAASKTALKPGPEYHEWNPSVGTTHSQLRFCAPAC